MKVYALKNNYRVSDDWLAQCVAPNILFFFFIKLKRCLAGPLIWAYFGEEVKAILPISESYYNGICSYKKAARGWGENAA
jgi:hypothetical protein